MMIKTLPQLLLLFGMITLHPQVFGQNAPKNILEGTIRVAQIEAVPTRPEEQQPNEEYVFDYRIIRYYTVSEEQATQLKNLVNGGAEFDAQNLKSCLFEPQFAILGSYRQKWFPLYLKVRGEVIVGTGSCAKVIVRKGLEESYYDMGEQSGIEKILLGL